MCTGRGPGCGSSIVLPGSGLPDTPPRPAPPGRASRTVAIRGALRAATTIWRGAPSGPPANGVPDQRQPELRRIPRRIGPTRQPPSRRDSLAGPRPVAAPTPTATAPGSHCKSTRRQPRAPRRSRSVRAGGEAGFLTRPARPGPRLPVSKAAAWCDPIRYRYSRGIRVVHAGSTRFNSTPLRQHCAPAETSTGATGSSGECSRSASRIDAARPSSSENPGSPQPPEHPAPQPDHRTTAPPPAPRCGTCQTPPVRAPGNLRSCRDTRVAHLKVLPSLFVVASRRC